MDKWKITVAYRDIQPELTAEEKAELESAEKKAIVYDEDCPKMTEEMLRQFVSTRENTGKNE